MRCELCRTDNARKDGRCGPGCPRHISILTVCVLDTTRDDPKLEHLPAYRSANGQAVLIPSAHKARARA